MSGPLTVPDLLTLWESVSDPGYAGQFLEAGDGGGLEAIGQGLAQIGRASAAVDRTTQAMFILPWSGQSDESASGARRSAVTLTIARAARLNEPLALPAGLVLAEEIADDFGPEGTAPVATGRRYALAGAFALGPGETSAEAPMLAERPGRGYDNPAPGSIRGVVQPGAGLANEGASVVPGVASHRLVAAPEPDVPIPEHVGQHVELSGANGGRLWRVAGYSPPDPGATPPTGGELQLAATGVCRISSATGSLAPGDAVEQPATGARCVAVWSSPGLLVFDRVSGDVAAGQPLVGPSWNASADAVELSPATVDDAAVAWRVVDWAGDLGLTIANAESPTGGRAAMLDELGAERRLPRATGEADGPYARRVATPADVVSPNAIVRTVNRVLSAIGQRGCLRETGRGIFRGLYYDGDPSSADPEVAFAYDLDFAARPGDRLKLAMDYTEFRAFFAIGVPPLDLGEFGCAYDNGPSNAYDAAPALAFYDGFPVTAATIYRAVWQACARAKAGGVGFDLYLDPFLDC